MRVLAPACAAVAMALFVITACEDDPAAPTVTLPEASSFDVTSPESAAPDAGPPSDARADAVDVSKIGWQLLPSLPADEARVGGECDVAVDADDHVLLTYGEAATGYAAPRSLAVFRHDGAAWSTLGGTSLVEDSGSYATWSRLAVAKDGTIYVAYNHQGSVVQRFAAGTWTALPAPPFTRLWAVAVDSSGMPAVIGQNSEEPRRVARFDGTAWSGPTSPLADLDGSGNGFLSRGVLAIAPRPDGTLAALVRTTTTKLGAYTLSGATWSALAPELADGAEFPELSSAAGGHLATAWSAGNNVYAARFDPAAQAFVELGGALGAASSRYAVTAIDSFDRPFVAWRVPMEPVKVSVFSGAAWQALPDPSTGGGTLPAIALDRSGLPVVCWEVLRDGGGGSEIIVARAVVE